MTSARLLFFGKTWARNLVSYRAIAAVLSSFGVLWLVVEVTAFFAEGTVIPGWLRSHWWLFGLLGFVGAAAMCYPRLSVAYKLNGRDVSIAIAIGDVFSFPGTLVVGSNTTFDTRLSGSLIAANSVQGQFTTRYYADDTQLATEVSSQLASHPSEQLQLPRVGNTARYKTGTVVRLNPKGRAAYFVALADLNPHGIAESTFEALQIALGELWVYIGTRGLKEAIVVPVLGTGFSRLPQPRETVIHEIVRSFVAACSERVFSDHLTIVLSPRDAASHHIDLEELGSFLRYQCSYAGFAAPSAARVGSAV